MQPHNIPSHPRADAFLGLGAWGRVESTWAGPSISVSSGPVPGVCPRGKRWLDCAEGPASCAELSAPQGTNQTCHPGCYCPSGTLLLVGVLPAWPPLGLGSLGGREGIGRAWAEPQPKVWGWSQGDLAELRTEH